MNRKLVPKGCQWGAPPWKIVSLVKICISIFLCWIIITIVPQPAQYNKGQIGFIQFKLHRWRNSSAMFDVTKCERMEGERVSLEKQSWIMLWMTMTRPGADSWLLDHSWHWHSVTSHMTMSCTIWWNQSVSSVLFILL